MASLLVAISHPVMVRALMPSCKESCRAGSPELDGIKGFAANYNGDPGPVNKPVIFEPTAELAESLEVWLGVSGGNFWGGCDVWVSSDGQTYRLEGRVTGPMRTGQLTATLPAAIPATVGPTIDQSNTLSVDLSESQSELLSTTQQQANSLA